MFTVTTEWIHACATRKHGWTKKQLAVLGVSWPPERGWLEGMAGREVTDTQRREFQAFSRGTMEADDDVEVTVPVSSIRLVLAELRVIRLSDKREQARMDAAIRRLESLL